jgi:serine/threonine protein kinase
MTKPDSRALAQERVGETLNGKWHLDRLIDIGGMAAVYAATHRNGKKVAVKLLHRHVAADKTATERFLREGYAANGVNHPNAVSVLDDDTTPDGSAYLVMDLLEGESVHTWIERSGGSLRIPDVLAIADQVLDVLASAHDKGIIHRDIKPANLFITTQGVCKVLDFGVARMPDPKGPATAAGTVIGSAAYMPPEQAQGKQHLIERRSDIFAVGAVMFRAASSKYVHDLPSSAERLFAAMKSRAPSLATVLPSAPPELVHVIDKALTFEIEGRWDDAMAMRIAIRAAWNAIWERAQAAAAAPVPAPPNKSRSAPPPPRPLSVPPPAAAAQIPSRIAVPDPSSILPRLPQVDDGTGSVVVSVSFGNARVPLIPGDMTVPPGTE